MNTIASQLESLSPGDVPLEIFNQIARLVVTPVIELVIYRMTDTQGIEVFLSKRSDTDAIWPGQYHLPGGIVSAKNTDQGLEQIAKNLVTKSILMPTRSPVFAANKLIKVERGAEIAIVFKYDATDDDYVGGEFYPISNLPKSLITGHSDMIDSILA